VPHRARSRNRRCAHFGVDRGARPLRRRGVGRTTTAVSCPRRCRLRSTPGVSGGELFPSESRTPWQVPVANGVLFVAWTVVVILLVMASIGWSRPQRRMSTRLLQDASAPRITLMAIFVFALLGSAVAAGGGGWYNTTYVPPRAAAERAALQLDRLDGCAVCLSSMDGRLTSRRRSEQAGGHRAGSPDPALTGRASFAAC